MAADLLSSGFATTTWLKTQVLPAAVEDDTDWDDNLVAIGCGVAGALNRHCNRRFQRGTSLTYSCTGDKRSVALPAFPIEQVTAATLANNASSDDILSSIETTHNDSGIVEWTYLVGIYSDKLTITYDGGYWLDPEDGTSQPDGSSRLPDEIREAFVLQCQAVIEHTNTLRTVSLRRQERQAAEARLLELDLLPVVKAILQPYVRYA